MSDFDPEIIVSTKALAGVLDVSIRRVSQLESEGVFRKVGHGRYRLGETVRAYLAFRLENGSRALLAASDSRSAFEAERARKLKLENDAKERQLIPAEAVMDAVDFMFGAVKLDLAGAPSRITPDAELQRHMSDAIDDALAALSERLEKASADLEAGRDPFAPLDALFDG